MIPRYSEFISWNTDIFRELISYTAHFFILNNTDTFGELLLNSTLK